MKERILLLLFLGSATLNVVLLLREKRSEHLPIETPKSEKRDLLQDSNGALETIAPEGSQLQIVEEPEEPTKTKRKKNPQDRAEWHAQYGVEQVQKLIALTSEEADKLRSALLAGEKVANLEEILGAERARQYEAARERKFAEESEEEIQSELFRLSRKLKLSSEQEKLLEGTLRSIRTALRPNYEKLRARNDEAMELHQNPPDDGTRLRGLFDELQTLVRETSAKERELLLQELDGQLSDEQMNLLVEDRSFAQ